MKRNSILLAFALIFCWRLDAQNLQIPVESGINKVTVFRSGAQVFRSAKVDLQKGRQVLIFKNLSPFLEENSIEVTAQASVQIVGVKSKSNIMDTLTVQVSELELEKKIERLKADLELEIALSDVNLKEEEMLMRNQTISGNNGLKTQDLREAMEYFGQKLDEVKRKRLNSLNKTQALKAELEKLYKLSRQQKADQQRLVSEIWVEVEVKEAMKGNFALSYKVKNASWSISYDLRMKDVQSPLIMVYNAKIIQNTGEDWNQVKLNLSTDNPNQPNQAPVLSPWYLGQNPPRPNPAFVETQLNHIKGRVLDALTKETLIGANVLLMRNGNTLAGVTTDIDGNFSISSTLGGTSLVLSYIGYDRLELPITNSVVIAEMRPNHQELKALTISSSKERNSSSMDMAYSTTAGVSMISAIETNSYSKPVITHTIPFNESDLSNAIVYEIELPYTIKANGEETKVAYKEAEIPCFYEYKVIPKLDLNVFLQAHLPNWESLELTDGEMNLYLYGTFKGRTYLKVQGVTQDTLDISMGVDKNIAVSRKNLRNYKKKEFMSSDRTEERAYQISVKNGKSLPIHLTVIDQVPVSPYEGLKVDKVVAEGAKQNNKTGELKWNLDLEPGNSRLFEFSYQLKVPKNFQLLE
ncbi:MAG: mucoidy inhibitor MuiA family protein [Bacteroidia bacterium]|nr:mucoidy inhibitor MuiA family protein [Bacteroidia bacterium]